MSPEHGRDHFGAEHGAVCANLIYLINHFLEQHPIARCFAPGTAFQLRADPPLVHTPDIAIVRNELIPAEGLPIGPFQGAPDVVVMVVAPTDKFDEVLTRVQDYFDAGTRRVWIVRPRVKMVTVHRTIQDVQIIAETQTLNGGDVFPGLEIPLAKVFR